MKKKRISKNNPTNQWFKMDADLYYRWPVQKMVRSHGMSGFGLFVMLLCRLRRSDGHELPLDYDLLSFMLRTPKRKIKSVVEDFGLFEIDSEEQVFHNQELSDFMQEMHALAEKNSLNGKKGALARYGRKPQLSDNNSTCASEETNIR